MNKVLQVTHGDGGVTKFRGLFVTKKAPFLKGFCCQVTKVTNHINKYTKTSKKDVKTTSKAILGGFVRHFVTCNTLILITMRKR